MPTLYYRPTCAYCQDVLRAAEEIGLELKLLNINSNPAIADELVARGGKRQVPYLVDESSGTEMYESEDIIVYLQNNYAH